MILFLLAFVAFLIIGIPISVSIGFSAGLPVSGLPAGGHRSKDGFRY